MIDTPKYVREMYPDVERKMLPSIVATIVNKGAHNLNGQDFHDAVQESRLAILNAMVKYDFNKADLGPYMGAVVKNTCYAMYAKTTQRRRAPRVLARDGDGWKTISVPPKSIEDLAESGKQIKQTDDSNETDSLVKFQQGVLRVVSFRKAMMIALDARERAVLDCKLDPPADLIVKIEVAGGDANSPSNVEIGEHLNLSKNQMDWAFYKIRNVFTEIASQEQFSDVFADMVEGSGWPTIHVSKGQCYHERFVERTLRARRLQGKPRCEETESCTAGTRRVVWYEWGAVVTVWRKNEVWTAVTEGQFNPRSGEVFGRGGARKLLGIDGYNQLAKTLADERRSKMIEENAEQFKILPHCVGRYDEDANDVICDGDGKDEGPCVHRDACVALRIRAENKGAELTVYVTKLKGENKEEYSVPKRLEKFAKMIRRHIKLYGIKHGRPTLNLGDANEKALKKAKKANKKPVETKPVVATRSSEAIQMDEWYERWLETICEQTGRQLHTGDSPNAGQLFVKDRRDKSGYVGLYCRTDNGRPVAVGCLCYKPRNNTMDIKFPLGPGEFNGIGKDSMKKLKPESHVDGAWTAISKGLDETGVVLAAEVAAKLINKGHIDLPEVS